jgi:C3HC zinc finger-like
VRRLRSFRPATWFCKPAPAGPIECARRGWVNAGQDLLSCEVHVNMCLQLGAAHILHCLHEPLCCTFTAPAPDSPAAVACTTACSMKHVACYVTAVLQGEARIFAASDPVTRGDEQGKSWLSPALHWTMLICPSSFAAFCCHACKHVRALEHRRCGLCTIRRPPPHSWRSWLASMQATAPGELRLVLRSWQPFQPCLLRRCDVNSCHSFTTIKAS